jgi:three-Cys-motif partner protein
MIADKDPARLEACCGRLKALRAPVVKFDGDAVSTIPKIVSKLHPSGLHFVFLDPFSLEALDFKIIEALSVLKRIDMLVHVSQMDLQRNLGANLRNEQQAYDCFAPGWRTGVNLNQAPIGIRTSVFEYWRDQVAKRGVWPSADMRLITADKNQPLYWLLLAAKHETAHAFWATASNPEGQGKLF